MIYQTDTGQLVDVDGLADIPDGWTMLPASVGAARWQAQEEAAQAEFDMVVAQAEQERQAKAGRRAELAARLAVLLEADLDEVADLLGIHLPVPTV